jgi:hypothetical protein
MRGSFTVDVILHLDYAVCDLMYIALNTVVSRSMSWLDSTVMRNRSGHADSAGKLSMAAGTQPCEHHDLDIGEVHGCG